MVNPCPKQPEKTRRASKYLRQQQLREQPPAGGAGRVTFGSIRSIARMYNKDIHIVVFREKCSQWITTTLRPNQVGLSANQNHTDLRRRIPTKITVVHKYRTSMNLLPRSVGSTQNTQCVSRLTTFAEWHGFRGGVRGRPKRHPAVGVSHDLLGGACDPLRELQHRLRPVKTYTSKQMEQRWAEHIITQERSDQTKAHGLTKSVSAVLQVVFDAWHACTEWCTGATILHTHRENRTDESPVRCNSRRLPDESSPLRITESTIFKA